MLALGAAIGTLQVASKSLAVGWDGARIATKPVLAVTMGRTKREALEIIVKGPGQKVDVRAAKIW